MTKKILIIAVAVILVAGAGFFVWQKKSAEPQSAEEENYPWPKIVYCGQQQEINPEQLTRIKLVEDSLCAVFGGEIFNDWVTAKEKYGVKIDLAQAATQPKILATSQHSGFPGDKLQVQGQEIKIVSVDATGAQLAAAGQTKTIGVGQTDFLGDLAVKVKFACGETLRTDFTVSEYACCPPAENNLLNCLIKTVHAAEEEDEDELTKKAREETEEDLKMSGRSGYKGLILPTNVAREYPSTDFALLPFGGVPDEVCCGCQQEYKDLSWWGDYLENQTRTQLLETILELNHGQMLVFSKGYYNLVERDEAGMRFALREINYIKQNEDYFDPTLRVPKGRWINPDYAVEGGVEFKCCENSKLVKISFSAQLVAVESEKKVFEVSQAPTACFDLVHEPNKLMSATEEFAQQVGTELKKHFNKNK